MWTRDVVFWYVLVPLTCAFFWIREWRARRDDRRSK